MASTSNTIHKNKAEASVEKVIDDAKGMANSLTLRISNWWNALMPLNHENNHQSTISSIPVSELESRSLEALRSSWYSTKEIKRLSNASQTSTDANSNNDHAMICLLGKTYRVSASELLATNYAVLQPLVEDFSSQPWFTYRHHFTPLLPSTYTTDSGWGCMMRSGQCLLGQAYFRQILGRGWRLKDNENKEISKKYIKIMTWFLDEMESRSPYSIHRIALLGKQYKKEIGDWFGPHTMALVIKSLVLDHEGTNLNVYINTDGVVYKSEILSPNLASSAYEGMSNSMHLNDSNTNNNSESQFSPTLILLPIMLGVDSLNKIYHSALKSCFEFPQSVGIAGGKPKSSLYFLGYEDDNIIYLNPHYSRAAIPSKPNHEFKPEDFTSYHCELPSKIDIGQLDPCMLLGFYCDTKEEFEDFCKRSEILAKQTTPIFRISDKPPVYLEDLKMEFSSDDLEEFS